MIYFALGFIAGLLEMAVVIVITILSRGKLERVLAKLEAQALKKPAKIINTDNPFKDINV
jgi:hypothetical protein